MIRGTERGSAAAKAKVLRGDVVFGIDGMSTFGMNRANASELVKGPAGTPVRLDVERAGKRILVVVVR